MALIGHSRLGKAALWAGAQDERFAIVISNDSGEGGAALARRDFGETIADLNRAVPALVLRQLPALLRQRDALPVDQHMLLALVAPRPLYVASATEDRWADPHGEFLAAKAAEPVYRLFGLEGLGVERQPPPDTPVGRTIGYHLRTGKHDVTRWDWDRYLDFADRHFGGATRQREPAPSRLEVPLESPAEAPHGFFVPRPPRRRALDHPRSRACSRRSGRSSASRAPRSASRAAPSRCSTSAPTTTSASPATRS